MKLNKLITYMIMTGVGVLIFSALFQPMIATPLDEVITDETNYSASVRALASAAKLIIPIAILVGFVLGAIYLFKYR